MVMRVAVVLLAGGQSQRMGGGDKNLMDLGGKPLLAHILDRVDIAGLPVLINANGDAVRYAGFGLPVMADVIDGFAGPLAGILTGFDWMRRDQSDCTHLLSMATDAPFLPPDLLARLAAAVRGDVDIAQAMSNGRRHPVFALWSRAVADDLRQALVDEHIRKIDDFTARHRCVTVDLSAEPDPFMNLNRPEDFAAAEILLAGAGKIPL